MTVEQAEAILLPTGIQISLRHRFAFDTGTILRLDNYAVINVFDDGRYYIQGEQTEKLCSLFGQTETAWDPNTWDGRIPGQDLPPSFPFPET